ncbi:MAG: hypothetical protein WBM13_02690 [Bacteroidia bacterium]
MYILSEKQIDYILNDIKVRGVEMEDLQLNLLDHVCCIIEYELEPGGNFETFYHQTITRFFKNELKEIEEETTLLLTFKHYYAMKKTMNTVGMIASIGIVLGAIFRFQHWPGANVMLLLGVILFSFVFLPIMFTLKLRESKEKKDKLILFVGCTTGVLFIVASVFKLLHWPGANVLVGAAALCLFFIFIPMYLFTGLRNADTKVNTIVNTVLIIAGSGLLMSLSTNRIIPQGAIEGMRNSNIRIIEKIKKVEQQNTLSYNDSLPVDIKYYLTESRLAKEYVQRMKTNLIMAIEHVDGEKAATMDAKDILNLDNQTMATNYMLGPDLTGEEGNLKNLQEKLHSLQDKLSKLKDAEKNNWELNVDVTADDFKYVPAGVAINEFAEIEYEILNMDRLLLAYYRNILNH